MASYSIATGQERLPDLMDRALAGEEVIITREGKAVELRVVTSPLTDRPRTDHAEVVQMLKEHLASMPMTTPYLELKRLEEEERGY